MKKELLLTCLFLLSVCFSTQACEQGDCEGLFKKAVDKARSLRLLATSRGFSSVYQVIVTAEDGGVTRENVEFGSLQDKYLYKTSQVNFYQDARTMVMIHHKERVIYLTSGTARKPEENQHSGMIRILDSLQRHLVFQGCTREFGTVHPGKGYTRVVLGPGSKLKSSGLKNVVYWLDAREEGGVAKIEVNYAPGAGYGMQKYEMIVNAMNASPTTEPFSGTALARVMRKDKLLKEFEGYRIVDKRK